MSYTPVITITFKIQDFLGDNASNAQVSVRLKNFGSDNPRVPGSCIISTPWVPVTLDGSGGCSFTPIGNDVITPANTYYEVRFTADTANTAALVIPYQFTGSGTQDLSQIIPFNQFGGSGGPSVSNLVVKNPTGLQIISNFGLSVPQIQDLTAPLLPHTAGGTDLGSAALPFADVYVGGAATNNIKITGSATAARTFTLPDANSNPVQPLSGATAHQWLTFIDSSGVQHSSQPAYSDLTGTPQLAITFGATSHQFLTSYTSTTGLFTAAQPAFTDISGTASTAQIPNLAASKITSSQLALAQGGTGVDLSASGGSTKILAQDALHVISARDLVASDIPSLDASKITTGQLSLARGGTGADLSATGGAHQVLKQSSLGGAVTVAQLAFTDISGSVAASQLPNPSATTLGGIESIAAQSHKWIDSISTSGVPSLTQPSVADLSDGSVGTGTVVLSSGPVINSATLGSATISSGGLSFGGSSSGFMTLQPSAVASGTLTMPAATDTLVGKATTDTLTRKTIDTAGTGNHVQIAGVDLPTSIGSNGYVLTNSSGSLVFAAQTGGGGTGTPGGNTNDIQYNAGGGNFGGLGMLSPAGTILPNLVYKNVNARITSTSTVDVYTCPANKRAIACEVTVFNNSGSTITNGFYVAVKIGGVYYQTTASNATAGNNAVTSRSSQYILEAGEILAVNIAQQPCNVWVGVMEFDNTSNLKSAKLTTFIAGDNTVYTVPVGKSAIVLPNTFTPCSGTVGTFFYGNLSIASRTIVFNLVPSGGSVGSTNVIATSASVGGGVVPSPNGSGGTVFTPGITGLTMSAGDFFSVNSDSNAAGQFAYVTVVEI